MKKTFTLTVGGQSMTLPLTGKFIYVQNCTGEFSLQVRDEKGSLLEDVYDKYDFIDLEGRQVKEVTVTDVTGDANTVVLKGLNFKVTAGNDSKVHRMRSDDLGVMSDTAATTDTGTFSLISLIKRLLTKFPSLGQATMGNSSPVVIASNQTAVPVSGPLTDAQMRATAVPVSGPLTDAELRATAVPVSGPLTDAELRAADVGVKMNASATGGATSARIITTATTNDTNVKASAGKVYAIPGTNTSGSVKYLKLYNKATTPTVGTDTPLLTFALPVGAFNFELAGSVGVDFSAGIGYGVTGAPGDADTTATAANDVIASIIYK